MTIKKSIFYKQAPRPKMYSTVKVLIYAKFHPPFPCEALLLTFNEELKHTTYLIPQNPLH